MHLEPSEPSDFVIERYPLLYRGRTTRNVLRSPPVLRVGQIWLVEYRNVVIEVGPVLDVQLMQAKDILDYLTKRLATMRVVQDRTSVSGWSMIQKVYLVVDPISGGETCPWVGKVVK